MARYISRREINVLTPMGLVSFHRLAGGGSYFESDDKRVMEAIERTGYYDSGIIVKDSVVAAKSKRAVVVVDEVTNCAEAKKWLSEHKGVRLGVVSKARVLEVAAEQGVEFPILMKK